MPVLSVLVNWLDNLAFSDVVVTELTKYLSSQHNQMLWLFCVYVRGRGSPPTPLWGVLLAFLFFLTVEWSVIVSEILGRPCVG